MKNGGPAQPDGLICLNVRPPTLGSGRHAPWVRVDGVQLPVGVGDNLVQVSAGSHRVQVAPHWDPARVRTLDVLVGSGATARVFYADPISRFFGGSLGTRYRQDWALRCLQVGGALVSLTMLVELISSSA